MYKSRLTLWGMEKHNRACDMAFMYRKKIQRDAQGKKSTFVVRSRNISGQEVQRYIGRKRAQGRHLEKAPANAPTPMHILCFSVPPSPSPESTFDNQTVPADGHAAPVHSGARSHGPKKGRRTESRNTNERRELMSQQAHREMRERTLSPRVPIVIRPPDLLQEHETLFNSIATYIKGPVSKKSWPLRDENNVFHPHGYAIQPADFADLCIEATVAFDQCKALQGRRLLSRAFILLPELLREEHPRFLERLFETFSELERRGFVQICVMIQSYMVRLARAVLPEGHIYHRICASLFFQDTRCTEIVQRSWLCLVDSWGEAAGTYSPNSVRCRANFLANLIATTEPARAARLLRELLATYEIVAKELDGAALTVVNRLAACLRSQGKFAEVERLVEEYLLQGRQSGCLSSFREADLLRGLALAQYSQHKYDACENNLRHAMVLFEEGFGGQDPTFIRCYADLANWLFEWGRLEEAAQMRQQLDHLIGPDEIDMEQGSGLAEPPTETALAYG